ncbi:MAG: sigma factor [Verrucomicrobiota bacterium]
MPAADPDPNVPAAGASEFSPTHWSVVLAAGQFDSPQRAAALEKLCGTYWYPLYAYSRRQGNQPADAEDLTQAFFSAFLEKNYVARADRDRGRFRTFLLTSFKNFAANEWDRARTVRRGGGRQIVSLDAGGAAGKRYGWKWPRPLRTPTRWTQNCVISFPACAREHPARM